MGNESITAEQITAEIAAYLEQPDYYAEGWRTTRQIAERQGMTVGKAEKILLKQVSAGKLERIIVGGRAWWRKKKE